MKVQVLVATMFQKDHELINKMNIQTDALVGNQCDRTSIEKFEINNMQIEYLNFNERGVGLNRNNCLMRATGDILILADDDMEFYDGYEEAIVQAFSRNPKMDFMILNIDENSNSGRRTNRKFKKINIFNYMNYGAARFVFRREAISNKAVFFNLNFGGGTKYSCGEDSLFLRDCLRKKINIYAAPFSIAKLNDDRSSSWFKGFNEKYFYDKGVFLGLAHPRLAYLYAIYFSIKQRKTTTISTMEIYKSIMKGIKSIKSI